jgi:hypothetical protein
MASTFPWPKSSTSRENVPPEGSESNDSTPLWVAAAGVGIAVVAILIVMNPALVLAANTPAGGDMGAHVAVPAYLRDVMLPEGRILGWSNDWFAGYPFLFFYFPLPALVTVLLDVLIPYGVAFKIVTILGLLALPVATYFLVRTMGFSRLTSTVAGAAGGAFVFMESFSIYGGNIPSTLAGEFSFSWSFAFVMIYLGLLTQIVRDGRRRIPLAGLVLGLMALTHLVTTLAAIIASLTVMRWKGGFKKVVATWGLGFAVAAFWAIPLLTNVAYSSDMAWVPLSGWKNVLPEEIWMLLLPAVLGLGIAVKRTSRSTPFVTLTVFPVIYYWLIQVVPDWLPARFHQIQGKLWNGRFLPFFFFGVWVFAGVALGVGLKALSRHLPRHVDVVWIRGLVVAGIVAAFFVSDKIVLGETSGWVAIGIGVLVLAATFALPRQVRSGSALPIGGSFIMVAASLAGMTFIPGWVQWNYSGYEGKPAAPEYFALMDTIDSLPAGRVMWEYNKDQNKYGTPMSLMLIPYWTEEKDPTMEGLFFESSLTTSFHFLNQAEMSYAPSSPIPDLPYHRFDFQRGLEHLALYDIRYYVTYTEEAKQKALDTPQLRYITSSDPFAIFELPQSGLVDVARYVPSVYDGSDFTQATLDWYEREGQLDRWLVADGPDDWPRVGDDLAIPSIAESDSGVVSDVQISNDRISFHTTAIGVPHMVKVSYFPDWKVVGAEGPYRAAPSLMVVIPTQENVVLQFRSSTAERAGMWLTVAALVFLAGTAVRARLEVER